MTYRDFGMGLALGAVVASLSCSASRAAEREALHRILVEGRPGTPIVIEVREGFDGDDREWWVATLPLVNDSSFIAIDSDDESEMAKAVRKLTDDQDANCRRLSEAAYDRLEAQKMNQSLDLRTWDRPRHSLVPNPDLSLAIQTSSGTFGKGLVHLDSGQRVPLPSGFHAVVSWSGDGSRYACWVSPGTHAEAFQRLVVADAKSGQVLNDLLIDRFIENIAWSEDGLELAVLCVKERLGHGPIEILGKLMGHGVPYKDFAVVIVDLTTGTMQATEVIDDVQYGRATILWDPRVVRSVAQ